MSTNDTSGNEFGGNDYQKEAVLRELYWGNEMSLKRIASEFGVCKDTIWEWMKRNNIERRTPWATNEVNYAGYAMDDHAYTYWYNGGENENVRVHRLLAVCEYGFDAVRGKHVHHKNEIPWDNRPDNIELKDADDHLRDHNQGESSTASVLTESDVVEILELLDSEGVKQRDIAEKYGVTESAISKIATGRSWNHVERG